MKGVNNLEELKESVAVWNQYLTGRENRLERGYDKVQIKRLFAITFVRLYPEDKPSDFNKILDGFETCSCDEYPYRALKHINFLIHKKQKDA